MNQQQQSPKISTGQGSPANLSFRKYIPIRTRDKSNHSYNNLSDHLSKNSIRRVVK